MSAKMHHSRYQKGARREGQCDEQSPSLARASIATTSPFRAFSVRLLAWCSSFGSRVRVRSIFGKKVRVSVRVRVRLRARVRTRFGDRVNVRLRLRLGLRSRLRFGLNHVILFAAPNRVRTKNMVRVGIRYHFSVPLCTA